MRFTRWDQVGSKEQTHAVVSGLVRLYLERCDKDPLVDRVRNAFGRGDTQYLASFEIPYSEVSLVTAESLSAISALFSKRQDLEGVSKPERREAAWRKFLAAEALCKQTNILFRLRSKGSFCFSPRVEGVLHASQRKIASVLKNVPKLQELSYRFGPGATVTVPKRKASSRAKLGGRLQCSNELEPILLPILYEVEGWVDAICDYSQDGDELVCELPVDIVPGKVAFVSKNAQTDRTIIVEPVLNSMFQLGLMDVMVRRLSRVGVDLSDQSRNQRLAKIGSESGALATLDLSSASDTVAKEFVYDQLPIDWAHLLSRGRTGTVTCDGEVLHLEKFSSMGNGFTFPLETLLFYGLACGACEQVGVPLDFVCVYGDDIIVPVEAYKLLVETLLAVGFLPNAKKSFSEGPFRESCGKDYFLGSDIRPFFLKGPVSGEVLFQMHNFAARRGDEEVRLEVLSHIDRSLRLWGPDGFGDGHLLGLHPRTRKPSHSRDGFAGYVFDTYVWRGKKDFRPSHFGDRVLPLYSVYASPPGLLWTSKVTNYLGVKRHRLAFGPVSNGAPEYYRGIRAVPLPGTDGYRRISIYTLG